MKRRNFIQLAIAAISGSAATSEISRDNGEGMRVSRAWVGLVVPGNGLEFLGLEK